MVVFVVGVVVVVVVASVVVGVVVVVLTRQGQGARCKTDNAGTKVRGQRGGGYP